MSSDLFPDVPEYEYKVHFVKDNGQPLCETQNPKEGTNDTNKVTCKRCIKLLDKVDEIEERGNIPLTLTALVTVESPPLTKKNFKKVIIAWLNLIPDNAQFEFKNSYNSPTMVVATWKEERNAVPIEGSGELSEG